ncbi:glycosyltransferase [Arthrobacter sp. UC242_113]|uniref:glycosyltransferase n=1 Tax=Arthrobacter sp. UC242_113 TaxID=3374550 RepID=UPI003757C0A9
MPKLLAFCVSEKLSGGELFTLELIRSLERIGWQALLLTDKNSALRSRATDMSIANARVSIGPKLGKRSFVRTLLEWPVKLVRFNRVIRDSPEAVLFLQYKLEQILWALSSLERPSIILEHGPIPSLILRIAPVRSLYIRALKKADLVLAASIPAQDSLRSISVESSLLIAGTDQKRIESARTATQDARSYLEGRVDAVRIGVFAGRITEEKGVLDAVALVEALDDTGLVIFGDGPVVDQLRDAIKSSTKVSYVGPVSDALPYIAAADFGVLLTRDHGEGRPLFGVECVSVGTPLVTRSGSAAIEGLIEEFGEQRIRVLDAVSAEALRSLLNHPRPRAIDLRTWDETARDFDSLFRAVSNDK